MTLLVCFFLFRPAKVDGMNDKAVIICSSGTTGLSKGTIVTVK